MEEVGESSRATGKATKKDSRTKVAPQSVDITRTKTWASIDPSLVDPGTATTHRKLDSLASMNQALTAMLLDQGVKLSKLASDISTIKQILGGSSPGTSRRSSIGSTSRRSSMDDTMEETAVDEGIDVLEFLDEFFESFVQSSTHKPLKKRTKNVMAAAHALVNEARQKLGETVGDDTAVIINEQLAAYDDGDLQELYITLSKRYHAHKSEGKKVATITENFETDVERDNGDGSQSTNANTPRPKRSTRSQYPKTPAPPRFTTNVDDAEGSPFVSDDADEDDEAADDRRRKSIGDDSYEAEPSPSRR